MPAIGRLVCHFDGGFSEVCEIALEAAYKTHPARVFVEACTSRARCAILGNKIETLFDSRAIGVIGRRHAFAQGVVQKVCRRTRHTV
jgi:hypothetical protein